MPKGPAKKKSKGERALDDLYKDGRKPTLKELADVIDEHDLELVSVEWPASRGEETPSQISQDEFQFYLKNRSRLAEVEKTLAVIYGEIKGGLDTQQAVSSPVHYSTMKYILADQWLFIQLEMFKKIFPADNSASPRLSELKSLVGDTMQFIETAFPDRDSYIHVNNADSLKRRLEKIGNAIGELRSLAEEKLISSIEKKEK